MGTVIIATGETDRMKALGMSIPVSMVPLMDRPFIQHVIEALASRGRKDIDIVLSHHPELIEKLLGDGSRWGCTFRYHLVRSFPQVTRTLRSLGQDSHGEPLLVADATSIPLAGLTMPDPKTMKKGPFFYSCTVRDNDRDDPGREWSGWAWIPAWMLGELPELSSWNDLYPWSLARFRKKCAIEQAGAVLRIDTYSGILDAQRQVLDKSFHGLLLTGTEVEEGVWLSRNVVIHPEALITPPVFLGQNCRIERGAQVGPHVVVCRNCVLDERTSVANSLIFPNTYVGQSLELSDAIVDQNRLINERYSSEIFITDSFILSGISEKQVRKWLSGVFSRVFAMTLLAVAVLFFPVLLYSWKKICPGYEIQRKQVVKLPAKSDPALWKTYRLFRLMAAEGTDQEDPPASYLAHFLSVMLPGLVNAARGDIQIVGNEPRTNAEIASLDPEWRTAYLGSKAGLITESLITSGPDASIDEVYSAEMLYSATFRRKTDLFLIAGYFGKILREITTPGSRGQE